jgi:hypothetical protein
VSQKEVTFNQSTLPKPKNSNINSFGPWQWPRGLRHELSSPVQTLGSRVRITLETWIYIVLILCVLSYV